MSERGKEMEKSFECDDVVSRQAVLKTLDNMDNVLDEDRTVENYKELLKECYEVLPTVRPQLCDDAISRQAVLEIVKQHTLTNDYEAIQQLPPVRPQEPKTGHWTKDECGNIICSECKRFRRDCRYGHTNYCNHCGAIMFEPQESGLTDEMMEHYKKLAEHYNGGAHEPIQDTDARD